MRGKLPQNIGKITGIDWAYTNYVDDMILLLNDEGRVINSNNTVEKWGIDKIENIIGKYYFSIFNLKTNDGDFELIRDWDLARENMLNREKFSYETKGKIFNRYLQFKFYPALKNSSTLNESKALAVLMVRDNTEQRVSVEKLEKNIVELRTIFNEINSQYIHIDSKGMVIATDGKSEIPELKEVSPGNDIETILPDEIRDECLRAIDNSTKTKKAVKLESTMEIKKGFQIFEYMFIPVHKDETIIIIKNITETKRMESMAQQIELTNSLGVVFSSLRHELGNPINSIKMTVTVLKENIKNHSTEKICEYIGRIQEELRRVEFLLKNLKSFSMWEGCVSKKVNIKGFFENFMVLIKQNTKNKNTKIEFIGALEDDFVLTDTRALHQILLNVVNNAVEALEGNTNGKITIETVKTDKRYKILIKDNGPGIPESIKDKIFNPFFTTKSEGTGLGLIISKKILSRIDGNITIKSKNGEGTLVIIGIPLLREDDL